MNFDNVQNWSIADGTVVRVTDSTEDVIWEKKYNVWIADLTNIGFLSPHYVASKYAVNNDSDFIAFSTKNHPNDDNLTEIIRPTHINGTKLRFENIYGNPPAPGDLTVDMYLTAADQYSFYDTIKSGLQDGSITASNYNQYKKLVKSNATESIEKEDCAGPTRFYVTQDSILYIFAKVVDANVSWNVPTTFRFDSNGQSDLSASGLDLNITDPDNVGWTIDGPSYVGNSLVSGDPLPISGTGNKSLSLAPDVNTSSERTFDLVLKASTGDVIATCNCTQDASAEQVHTLTITHEVCGKLNVASGDITLCVSPFGTLNEFNEDYIELGTTDYVNDSDLGLSVAHSVIEQLSTKLNVGDWMDCNYLYFWVKNGSTQANVVPVFGSTSKTQFTNATFVFYEYDLITSNLKAQLKDFAASGNTDSIDLSETYGVNMLSTRKMTLTGTFPVAFYSDPTGYDMEAFLRLYYHAGSEICYAPVIPIQLFDNIDTSTDSNGNIIKNINFYRVIPLTQSTNYITFNGWEIFLINNNYVYNVVAKAHDGHIDLTEEPHSYNMDFGFSVDTGPDNDTVVAGDKWLAPFDEDGDQCWDFGSLDNDCTMDVSAATGESWIALFS